MKKAIVIIAFLCLSCSKEQPKIVGSHDFPDRLIDFSIEYANSRTLELPDLYEKTAKFIPDDEDENIILVEKLKARGFKVTDREKNNYPLGGVRMVSVKMSGTDCDCEVNKIYHTTAFVSEFAVTESISCEKRITDAP